MTSVPEPNACRWCGVDERGHFQRWVPNAGWHMWAEPTDAQRKERMLARRRGRSAVLHRMDLATDFDAVLADIYEQAPKLTRCRAFVVQKSTPCPLEVAGRHDCLNPGDDGHVEHWCVCGRTWKDFE